MSIIKSEENYTRKWKKLPALHTQPYFTCLLSPAPQTRRPYLTNYTMNINCSPKQKSAITQLMCKAISVAHSRLKKAIRSIQQKKKLKYMAQFPSVCLKFIRNSILSPSNVWLNLSSVVVCTVEMCRLNVILFR